MRISAAELQTRLALHVKWFAGERDGVQLDLSNMDLSAMDLPGANMRGANLMNVILVGAVLPGADLSGADLGGAMLGGANLSGANLTGADLRGAILTGTNLSGANLSDADLSGNTAWRAKLNNANLSGARFDDVDCILFLASKDVADLSRVTVNGLPIPIVPNIDAAILEAIGDNPTRLSMTSWHACKTTHCRAGWAIVLAGEAGKDLERWLGPEAAGALIYAASRPGTPIPDFFASHEDTLADIRRHAAA